MDFMKKLTNVFTSVMPADKKNMDDTLDDFKKRIDIIVNDLIEPYMNPNNMDNDDYKNMLNLLEPKKCNKIGIIMSSNLDKKYTQLEVEDFAEQIFIGTKNTTECKDDNCSKLDKRVMSSKKKKHTKRELCNAISIHYIKILNLIAAILSAVNPENNLCLNRLQTLFTELNKEEKTGISRICDAKIDKDSILNDYGMRELILLYYFYYIQDMKSDTAKAKFNMQYRKLINNLSELITDEKVELFNNINEISSQINKKVKVDKKSTEKANQLNNQLNNKYEILKENVESLKKLQSNSETKIKTIEKQKEKINSLESQIEELKQVISEYNKKSGDNNLNNLKLENDAEVNEEEVNEEEGDDAEVNEEEGDDAEVNEEEVNEEDRNEEEGDDAEVNEEEVKEEEENKEKGNEEKGNNIEVNDNSALLNDNSPLPNDNSPLPNDNSPLPNDKSPSSNDDYGLQPTKSNKPNSKSMKGGLVNKKKNNSINKKSLKNDDDSSDDSSDEEEVNDDTETELVNTESGDGAENNDNEAENNDNEVENNDNETENNDNEVENNDNGKINEVLTNEYNSLIDKFISFVGKYNEKKINPEVIDIIKKHFKNKSDNISDKDFTQFCKENNDKLLNGIKLNVDDPRLSAFITVYQELKEFYLTNSEELLNILETNILEKETNSDNKSKENNNMSDVKFSVKNLNYKELNELEDTIRDKLSDLYSKCHASYLSGVDKLYQALTLQQS